MAELKRVHPKELYELTWSNVYSRPDLQIKSVVLKVKDDYTYFRRYTPDTLQARKFADAAYNGGRGGVEKERRACAIALNCNPEIWDANVEKLCLKSKKPLYAGRSACDINRHHVVDVFNVRSAKYKRYIK